MANKIANRKVICDTLLEAAETDKDIVVLCSDSRGSASLTPFFDQYPQQSVEVGIAEQDLVSIAAGMASCGKKAWAASPASFVTTRSYEQCKVDVSYSNTNVKLIGISGVGPKAALAILSVGTPEHLTMAVITGDENSADQMAAFCNQFDKVCTSLGCAVIYCHHHSKGAQGGKRSMDRASGSGVFARDPDALLDMIELEVTDAIREQRQNNAACRIAQAALRQAGVLDKVGQDDLCSRKLSMDACMNLLSTARYNEVLEAVGRSDTAEQSVTAWRIEGTLREFPSFPALNVWFEYPVHHGDVSGVLADILPEAAIPSWQRNLSKSGKRSKSKEERVQDRNDEIEEAFNMSAAEHGETTISELAAYIGKSEDTVRRRLKEHGGFWVEDGKVGEKQSRKKEDSALQRICK